MNALLYGVAPDARPIPDDANDLERGLARTPMRLVEVPDARPLRPDWVAWRDAFAALARQERSGAMKVAFDFR